MSAVLRLIRPVNCLMGVVGVLIGAMVGILAVKKFFHYQGSLALGIIGLIIGGVISYFVFGYVVIGSTPLPDKIEWGLALIITPLFTTLGYCLFKKDI